MNPNHKKTEQQIALDSKFFDGIEQAKELIAEGQTFVIGVHARPDPDAIGSALALARGLGQIGKDVTVISQDGVPEMCEYLSDTEDVFTAVDIPAFDVAVICDANELGGTGTASDVLKRAKSLLVIDHHIFKLSDAAVSEHERLFEKIHYLVESKAASTAQVVYELLVRIDGIRIDKQMAEQLMAGVVGDTGAFRFSNVDAWVFRTAAALAENGAGVEEAVRGIFDRSLTNARLLGAALLAAQISEDGKVVWSSITMEDFEKFHATDADTDNISNALRDIRGVRVGILFREIEPEQIRISLRSRDEVDVNRIARVFGGGGHVSASGCTVKAPLEDAQRQVLAEVRACMES